MKKSASPNPLRPREQWILAALAEAPLHGYALMDTIERMSGGAVRIGAATLYRTLDALSAQDLIEVAAIESHGERTRTQFKLTATGRALLRAEVERLEATTLRFRRALGGAGDG